MEVINGQERVETGQTMKNRHSSNLKIIVMMVRDEVDIEEDEEVAVDLEEGSEVGVVVATTRMATAEDMVVTMVAIEVVVVAIWTVMVVMDTEAKGEDVVASEDKMHLVDLEVDEEVTEVTVVMVAIIEDSEVDISSNNSCV